MLISVSRSFPAILSLAIHLGFSHSYGGELDRWHLREPSFYTNSLFHAEYSASNGLFVAFGGDAVPTSIDGQTWGRPVLPASFGVQDVCVVDGRFVAVGASASGNFLLSSNGTHWFIQQSLPGWNLKRVAYGNGKYVASGQQSGSYGIMVSSNLVNWSLVVSSAPDLADLGFGNGIFVGITEQGAVLTSPDGLHRAYKRSGTGGSFQQVAFGNSRFVATGGGCCPTSLLISEDGESWALHTNGVPWFGFAALSFFNGTFIGGNDFSPTNVFTSVDGTNWIQHNFGVAILVDDFAFWERDVRCCRIATKRGLLRRNPPVGRCVGGAD
jgi:hypothetical protein